VPDDTPVTTPDEFTVATEVLELDQEPPVVASVKETVLPLYTEVAPEIAAGIALTVMVTVLLVTAAGAAAVSLLVKMTLTVFPLVKLAEE